VWLNENETIRDAGTARAMQLSAVYNEARITTENSLIAHSSLTPPWPDHRQHDFQEL
jgi:hypothetical protein